MLDCGMLMCACDMPPATTLLSSVIGMQRFPALDLDKVHIDLNLLH